MSVKALFVCGHKQGSEYGTHLRFHATQGQSGEESKSFNDATPGGSLEIYIAPGKEAADFFEQGKAYYLTFDEAPQG
jgi:hypothetical protein